MTGEELEQQKKTLETGIVKMEEGLQAVNELIAAMNLKQEKKWEWWYPLSPGDMYWFVASWGCNVQPRKWRGGDEEELEMFWVFNVFRSAEEAEEFKHLGTYQRKWAMILKELNPKNLSSCLYLPGLSLGGDIVILHETDCFSHYKCLYANSPGICEKAMQLMGKEDLKKMLGVD